MTQSTINDQLGLLKELLGRHPVAHHWDATEPRMLCVQYEAFRTDSGKKGSKFESWLASFGRTGKHAQVSIMYNNCKYAKLN